MHSNLCRTTSKIVSLAKLGRISCARKVFDNIPDRDVVSWNAMLSSYTQMGLYPEALSLFQHMRVSNTNPDQFSFTATLNACAGINDVQNGAKLHALILVLGYQSSLPVNNSLIDMYGKCLEPSSASKVFKEVNETNEVTWCSLLYAYTNTGQFNMANEVFRVMPNRVTIAWNIMIAGHAKHGEIELCLSLFKEMRENMSLPDQWTLSALMNACAESSELIYGCMVHAFVIKIGWRSAVEAKNSILSFYAKVGCQSHAIKEFESTGMLSQVSWNAIIDAYMKTGDTEEAFNVFQRAPEKNVVSWTSMITGMVHGCVIHYGFHAYVYVCNGLVNMYAKCGDIEGSIRAFSEILYKDLVSWNALLFGFGMHGLASEALQLYDHMIASGTKPDKVTFIGLLITCSHAGLIEKGRMFFESMESVYGLSYEMDHVACMVDMLGRGGYLKEAEELAKKLSNAVRSKTSSSEAMLGACYVHGDVELGTYLGEDLKTSEPKKETSFVLLSNLYCASGKWKEAEMVRKAMMDQGVKKLPGCSWIRVKNEVAAFVAGNNSHPSMGKISEILHYLEFEMRNPCFNSFKN
ncbi:hypothetical protein Patl1_25553 [Pistacia atlantica]|uniref:Uncharacterized protein n=1 Tax=Pistacia atlantica TaxID=434234 RepID=A0ACC1B0U7_9ROSI|nr:hypothetical protein Patl1_25553 [Pistacia atlantica]